VNLVTAANSTRTARISAASVILGAKRGYYFAVGHFEFQNAEDIGPVLGAISNHRNLVAGHEHFFCPPAPVQNAWIGEFPVPFNELAAIIWHVDKKLAMGIDKIELHDRSLEARGLRSIVCRGSMVREHWTRK
jgi:hypothetical protein